MGAGEALNVAMVVALKQLLGGGGAVLPQRGLEGGGWVGGLAWLRF
jgi:hypothetical protein